MKGSFFKHGDRSFINIRKICESSIAADSVSLECTFLTTDSYVHMTSFYVRINIIMFMLDGYSMQCYKASMLLLGVLWKS